MPDTPLTIENLVQALQTTTKAVPSSTPTTTFGHGPGGLFSSPALEKPVISAMVLPSGGVQSRLPLVRSRYANPLYGIMTGVTATTGSEAAGPCDDFPVAGLTKMCSQTAYFARQGRSSRVFELDRMGLLTSRGEHLDFQLIGTPWGSMSNMAGVPTIPGPGGANGILNSEYGKASFELAVSWQRDFAREFFTGNPSNNNAGGGRKYYRGLDLQINTGYRDAETGQACAAADSIVRSFGNLNIATNGATMVRQVTNIVRNIRYIASHAGLSPIKLAIAMRWSAFYELTEVWPCAYLTYRCTNLATNSTNFVDSAVSIQLRDQMRGDMYAQTGQYLMVDGEPIEVIIDDGIVEDGVGAGEFRSTMYFIPLTVLGGIPVTYMEYVDYDGPGGAEEFAAAMGVGGFYKTSDAGRFLWHFKPPTNYCVQFQLKTEPRLILRTPFLAARLTGIQYTPVAHEREPFTDSTYFTNGGVTVGVGASYYSPTA